MNNNETEVLAQTCHGANRAFAAAMGDTSIPDWAGSPEWQKNATRNRVNTELQRLRNGAIGNIAASAETTRAGSAPNGGEGSDIASDRMKDAIFTGIVRGFYEAQPSQPVPA